MRSSEKNRYQNCLTVSNVGLGSVLSDCFGKTAQGIMRQLASPEGFDEGACLKLIKGSARKKASRIIDSVRDCDIGPDQRFEIEASMGHMDYLDDMIARCELELYVRMRPHWGAVELLCGMPGITELSACLILSETGVDMSQFEDADHLCSWAGIVPGNNESAGKKKSVRIGKAGQFLKPVLVQCALAAVKSSGEDYFAIKCGRLRKRRDHKKAAIAIVPPSDHPRILPFESGSLQLRTRYPKRYMTPMPGWGFSHFLRIVPSQAMRQVPHSRQPA